MIYVLQRNLGMIAFIRQPNLDIPFANRFHSTAVGRVDCWTRNFLVGHKFRSVGTVMDASTTIDSGFTLVGTSRKSMLIVLAKNGESVFAFAFFGLGIVIGHLICRFRLILVLVFVLVLLPRRLAFFTTTWTEAIALDMTLSTAVIAFDVRILARLALVDIKGLIAGLGLLGLLLFLPVIILLDKDSYDVVGFQR